MRGDTHVRFGGRVRETDPGQPGHRARARPHRSDTTVIVPEYRSADQRWSRACNHYGTPQGYEGEADLLADLERALARV